MHLGIAQHPSQGEGQGAWLEGAWVRERSCPEDVLGRSVSCPSSFCASENFLSIY